MFNLFTNEIIYYRKDSIYVPLFKFIFFNRSEKN